MKLLINSCLPDYCCLVTPNEHTHCVFHTDSGLYHKTYLVHWDNSKHDVNRDCKSYLYIGACLLGTCSWNSAIML